MKLCGTLLSLLCVCALPATPVLAGEQSITMGADYANDVFFSLTDNGLESRSASDWDLAFEISGFAASVLVNHAKGIVVWHAFGVNIDNFDLLDTNGMTTNWEQTYNSETSWSSGALNLGVDPNSGSLGWGEYNPITHHVDGTEIFVLQLDATTYVKLMVESLKSGVYTIRYANLDGSNAHSADIAKSEFSGKNFAYYSLDSHTAIDREPLSTDWDIVFGRYIAYVGENGDVPYVVSGVRSNIGVLCAQADDVDPLTVSYSQDMTLSEDINIIGHDWKEFSFSTNTYVINESVAYFVQAHKGGIYKVYFTEFGGGADGKVGFEVGEPLSTDVAERDGELFGSMALFPAPVRDGACTLSYAINRHIKSAQLRIVDLNGHIVLRENVNAGTGMHQLPLNVAGLAAGQYAVQLRLDGTTLMATLQIH